jgi:single-strand DNA-binding protein
LHEPWEVHVSRSLNKVILIGNLGADPEVRSTSNGSRVATLSLATSRQWKNQSGEKQEKTEWHRVILWNNKGSGLADVAEKYCKKGDKVYVEGSIEYRSWQDREGQTRYTTEITARELILLSGRGRRCAQGQGPVVRGLPRGARRRGRRPAVLSRFSRVSFFRVPRGSGTLIAVRHPQ